MITSPAGGTFLIAEARSATPASVRLLGPDGEPIALGEVVTRLLGRTDRPGAGDMRARMNEVTLPDCRTWLEDGALIIDLPEVGALHFSRHDPAAGQGPSVSVFMPDGDTATIDELIGALSRSLTSPQAHVLPHEQDDPTITDKSPGADPGTTSDRAIRPRTPRARCLWRSVCRMGSARMRARSPSSWFVACPPAPASRPASRATMAAGCCRRATSAGCRSCRLRAGPATSPSRSSRSRCKIGTASSRRLERHGGAACRSERPRRDRPFRSRSIHRC